ncbi:glycoside hydrolase family 47 protein [Mycena alexandri]|uniref:alpha-1,2-Mannosidase n=1 Tax=Mycena alexandri TaxID=1745969 RepID=A0AAD6XB98_9AGAR|nr:glycoside hydrolase family 47 protein [Mycena alexandri]
MRLSCILALLGAAAPSLAGVTVQKPGLKVPAKYAADKAAAQKLFTTSWAAYQKFAFGHDELHPVSEGTGDDLGGWGASLVDAMGTMLVMGLDDLFVGTLNFTAHVNFTVPPVPQDISVFETTIRWVGGLVSAYELSGFKYPILIEKAKEVADKLAFAWVGDNAIPFNTMDFTKNAPVVGTTNIAQAGTLLLEWTALSTYTRNATYGELAQKSSLAVTKPATPLPGLAPQVIDPATGQFDDAYITWGGGSDSYFEYLLKFARYTNNKDTTYIDTWKTAVDSSIHTLLKKSTVGNWSYLADQDDQGLIRHVGSHLACFYAGNWLLGGKLLKNQTIIDIALDLNEGCWNTYAGTVTGIGPETFAFVGTDGNFTGGDPITADQQAFYNKHGYYITGSDYIQRPEVLESNFHAWRVTGDTKYLDRAAGAIASFNKYLTTTVAFACLNDVNDPSAGLIDDMESFWFAEVLKYLYLTFDDPSHISLDTHVWNTECHPLIAPPALNSYAGSGKLIPQKPFVAHTTGQPRPAVSPI